MSRAPEPVALGDRALRLAVTGEPDLVVTGLRSMLRRHLPGASLVVAERHTVAEADLLLHDPDLAECGTLDEVVRTARSCGIPLVELSWSTGPERMRRAHDRGATAVVFKGTDGPALARALEAAARDRGVDPGLSEREIEVLAHVAAGLTNADIAARCHLSPNTVKTYIRTAYRKIRVQRRSQAVAWAIRNDVRLPASALETG